MKTKYLLTLVCACSLSAAMDFKVLASEAAKQAAEKIDNVVAARNVERLYQAIVVWIEKHSTAEERAKWSQEQSKRVAETDRPEGSMVSDQFYTMCFDRRNLFEEPDRIRKKDLFGLGMLYRHIIENSFPFPSGVLKCMTTENTDRVISYLTKFEVGK